MSNQADAGEEHTCAIPENFSALPARNYLNGVDECSRLTLGNAAGRSHDQGEAQLQQILQQGVTTFICLQVTASIPIAVLLDPTVLTLSPYGPQSLADGQDHNYSNLKRAVACVQAEIPQQIEMKMGGVNGFVPYAAVATLLVSAMSGPPDMKVLMHFLLRFRGRV